MPFLNSKIAFQCQAGSDNSLEQRRRPASGYASKGNVVCYFSNWAAMREGDGKFVPENLVGFLISPLSLFLI